MDFSKEQKLKNKVEELKSDGLTESDIKKIFIKEYLLEDEEKSVDEMFHELLSGRKKED